jgi:hypothetical protein
MEQVPELKVGAMLRINHMVVEVFGGRRDGRVSIVQWFLCGGVWDGGQYQAHQNQEGGEYDLGGDITKEVV